MNKEKNSPIDANNKKPEAKNLLDSIQEEVAPEVSPLLVFIAKYGRKIALVFLLLIVAIAALGIWRSVSSSNLQEQRIELGKRLEITDPAERLKALEAFLPEADNSLKVSILLEAAKAAQGLNDYAKAEALWKEIAAKTEGAFKLNAVFAQAGCLAQLGKEDQAIRLLEDQLKAASGKKDEESDATKFMLLSRVASLAESSGQLDKAIEYYEIMVKDPAFARNKSELDQKIASLRQMRDKK